MTEKNPLRDKLRRLRREPGQAGDSGVAGDSVEPEPGSAPEKPAAKRGAGLPPWLRQRIREKQAASGGGVGRGRSSAAPEGTGASRSTGKQAAPVELVEARSESGEVFAERVRRFQGDHAHGAWLLEEIRGCAGEELALLARDPKLAGLDLERAVFLDVETTGLSGGAGTISFLVALGSFRGAGSADPVQASASPEQGPQPDRLEFTLWQGFLPGPECERAMLSEVARRVRAHDALVTFFGKSFDRHRLEDKMRLHGIEPPFAGMPHLDLYHPLRRYYGGAFQDARLQTMELGLCGVQRADDLPGSFAPEAWFDFLAGRSHRLEDVFRHNEDDVLSLVVLAGHLGRLLSEQRVDGEPLGGPGAARAAGLMRLFEQRKEWELGLLWSARALERGRGGRSEAFLRAKLLARGGRQRAALGLFAEIARAQRDEFALLSWIELAKLREHQTRDPDGALDAVRHALGILSVVHNEPRRARVSAELMRRSGRLERLRERRSAGALPDATPNGAAPEGLGAR